MAIKTLVAGHLSPREWVGTCPRCRGHFSWNDTDSVSVVDKPGKEAYSILLCPTTGCPSSITGKANN